MGGTAASALFQLHVRCALPQALARLRSVRRAAHRGREAVRGPLAGLGAGWVQGGLAERSCGGTATGTVKRRVRARGAGGTRKDVSCMRN